MIDYEKSFKKLVEQIKFESKVADNECNRNMCDRYNFGAKFAYDSIKELVLKLENDEFFDEDYYED